MCEASSFVVSSTVVDEDYTVSVSDALTIQGNTAVLRYD